MSDPMLQLQVLVRSEVALLRLQVRRATAQAKVLGAAAAFLLLALAMGNVAVYQFLVPRLGPSAAALVVGGGDLLIALVLLVAGRDAGPGPEEERAVNEVRDLAYRELNAGLEQMRAELTKVTDDVQRIRNNFGKVTDGIGPVVGLVAGAIRKGKKKN